MRRDSWNLIIVGYGCLQKLQVMIWKISDKWMSACSAYKWGFIFFWVLDYLLVFIFQVPVFCGFQPLEKVAARTSWCLGRSGRHLFLTDRDKGKPPLLIQMVNDTEDLNFLWVLVVSYICFCNILSATILDDSRICHHISCLCRSALQSFRRRVAYANVLYDRIL